MKKLIINTIAIVVLATGFTACSDDYFDVNTPDSAVDFDLLDEKHILPPVIHSTLYAQYYAITSFSNYTQYFGSYGSGAAGKSFNLGAWNQIYLDVLPNTKLIRDKAIENNALHYKALADILEAINIALAADSWNDIPYSEATTLGEIRYPKLDSQQEVYQAAISLLDNAITGLKSSDDSGYTIGNDDMIYGGDIDRWLRAAYTLKARLQLHLIGKGGATPADVLTSISNGFTSNEDNFMMSFPEDKINPHYSTNILSRNTGNFYRAPNDQLISMMNGTTYPFESGVVEIDPRLPAIYENEGGEGDPWRGFMNGGEGESSDGEDGNVYYKDGGYYTTANAPLILITFAEAKFIEAEALFLANGGNTTSVGSTGDAYAAYMAGIEASMGQIGVNGSDYMADTSVDVGEAGLALHHIMKEKYIANIHNVETYNDFRRYNFSSDVFKGLELRLEVEADDDEYSGQWFRRAVYPAAERTANPNVKEVEPTVSIWWAE